MRIVEIYGEAGFPMLVVESKKEFATRYAVDAEYWQRFDIEDSPEVVGFLKTNLNDLANHYHALYQEEAFLDEQPQNFAEASRWYRQFLYSFPSDEETPQVNYQLADLLLENEDFGEAALEYERTAYEYAAHEQASAAGYAAIFAHREDLKVATGARTLRGQAGDRRQLAAFRRDLPRTRAGAGGTRCRGRQSLRDEELPGRDRFGAEAHRPLPG